VFAAFVDPAMLRKFWLKDASGALAPNARVKWQFMVPGAEDDVSVTRFDPPNGLAFDWSDGIHIEMKFEALDKAATRAAVTVGGFAGDSVLEAATDAVEGFSIVLCDLKTLLETGRSANLVRDKAELITRAKSAHK
jgi:uncharacterized protein YndB with AHSA1/START domain